jgi:hypothetical protein
MKRLLPVLLMALLVGACGGSTPDTESPATSPSESPVAEVTQSPTQDPTPADCPTTLLTCEPIRAVVLSYPGLVEDESALSDGFLIVFEDGRGLSRMVDAEEDITIATWSFDVAAVASLFTAFAAAPVYATLPLGQTIDPQSWNNYVKGRLETPAVVPIADVGCGPDAEECDGPSFAAPLDGLIEGVILANEVFAYSSKTGKIIYGDGGAMPSVDPQTIFAIDSALTGTIVREADEALAIAAELVVSGDKTTQDTEELSDVMPAWISPESNWTTIFAYKGL